jgi:hypothetical protein
MRKLIGVVALVAGLALQSGVACAHDAYDDSQSHPLQLVAYAVNPIGWSLEWLVARPIHFVVSQPKLEKIFGHRPHEAAFGDYTPYSPDTPD